MALQRVTLRVPIPGGWDAGGRVQVYTDSGSGTVDTSKPLLARAVEVFPGAVASRGFGITAFGSAQFGDNKPSRPHVAVFGRELFGKTPFCNPEPFVLVGVDVPAAFGKWKFAVEAVDRFGNTQSGGVQEIEAMVSGTEPPPLKSFAVNGYDDPTDRLTFDFVTNAE